MKGIRGTGGPGGRRLNPCTKAQAHSCIRHFGPLDEIAAMAAPRSVWKVVSRCTRTQAESWTSHLDGNDVDRADAIAPVPYRRDNDTPSGDDLRQPVEMLMSSIARAARMTGCRSSSTAYS